MKRTKLFGFFSLLIVLMVSTFLGVHSYGLQQDLKFEHISSEEGLSHDTVYSIIQDRTGYLWFGTEDGLNKYDGYKITTYRGGDTPNSIGNANCAVLYVDDSNSIWIASWGGGLAVLDQEEGSVRSYMNDSSDPDSISDNNVQSIFQDSSGTLWFGTYTQGLNRFDSKTEKFVKYTHDENDENSLSDNRVWWITETADGNLLLGTNKGLDKFNPETGEFTHYNQIEPRVRTIFWDKENVLWLGTQSGLCKFNPDTGEYTYYLHGTDEPSAEVITSIYEDSNGTLWVGSSNGINVFDRDTERFTRYINESDHIGSLSNDDVRVIFEDKSGNLWIGTRGGGINKIDVKDKKFHFFDNMKNDKITLSDINVTSIFQDLDGILWVGTNNGGLNRFDLRKNTQDYLLADITKEENRNISAIVDYENSIWVGSLGGLNKIEKSTGERIIYKYDSEKAGTLSHNTVLSLLRDSKNILWVGTLEGLNRYDAGLDSFIHYLSDESDSSISSDMINCLYEDSNKNLWIGTQNGLNLFDREKGVFERFLYSKENNQSISDNIIHCIFEDSTHNLWVGTQYGLNHFDQETGTFSSYTTEDGLPNNGIKSIEEDAEGRLWISTNKGISCFNERENIFINYDSFDGLQGNGYNNNASEKISSGEILFGGLKGLDFIDSERFEKSTYKPQIAITGFRVMNKEYNIKQVLMEKRELSLPYNENNIWIEFSSLDYTMPGRNQYAYMLEGFDEDWIYLGTENSFNYTNIPSGDYVLRIKGSNSDGIWNEEGISIGIHISKPWWLSDVAYIIYLIAILAFLYMTLLYITRRQKRHNATLFKMLQNTIEVMSKIGEMRDKYTASHQRRVQKLACAIASEMGLPEETIDNIYFGALIHDIGKINIASEFLNKPGKLTDLEYKILQTHVQNGVEIIREINFPEEVSSIVAQHHERLDGGGYPLGIRGEQIAMVSRIVAVADVVEAMSFDRPYRPALGIDTAIEEITLYQDIKYDSKVVAACTILFREKGFVFSEE